MGFDNLMKVRPSLRGLATARSDRRRPCLNSLALNLSNSFKLAFGYNPDFPWNRSPPPKLVGLALLPTRSIRSQQTRLIVSTIDQDAGHCIHGFLTRLDSINRKTEG